MKCPACGSPLVETLLGEARFAACERCGAALVPNNQLVPLMEAVAGGLIKSFDEEAHIEPAPPREPAPRCPGCSVPMRQFGYMGSPLAPLYRCDEHSVVFGDEAGLGTAALLYARTHKRLLERKSKDDALRESWARSSRARAAGRAAGRAQLMGFMFGGIGGAVAASVIHDAATKKGH